VDCSGHKQKAPALEAGAKSKRGNMLAPKLGSAAQKSFNLFTANLRNMVPGFWNRLAGRNVKPQSFCPRSFSTPQSFGSEE
jgi:hypothetical protein